MRNTYFLDQLFQYWKMRDRTICAVPKSWSDRARKGAGMDDHDCGILYGSSATRKYRNCLLFDLKS